MAARASSGPVFDVKGKRGVDYRDYQVKDAKKLKTSAFTILLNTNIKPKTKEEIGEWMDQYPEILENVINSNPEVMKKCFSFVAGIQTNGATGKKTFQLRDMTDAEYSNDIKYVKSRFQGEVGLNFKQGGRFHLHCTFFVVHTSKIQMDMKPLIDKYNESLEAAGLPPIKYFHTKSEKPNGADYQKKYYYASLKDQ